MSINGARGNRLPRIRTSFGVVFHATCGFCLQPEVGKLSDEEQMNSSEKFDA
ncbi:hypothetical protein [Burkholderia vietnamiensis]|uniref:hypothetical protein n=1 Tax=Burkholderia vietnamiensis TaxID=60552 RepID=UPI0012D89634|nr:hypothetical protein [Burkholderia vietnamiensis]MDN7923980.1 hypothetical protein [Burkholderia vietnamiensis]HDR9251619.1 hypothetical protein [Burkholderia vietnamiensis]